MGHRHAEVGDCDGPGTFARSRTWRVPHACDRSRSSSYRLSPAVSMRRREPCPPRTRHRRVPGVGQSPLVSRVRGGHRRRVLLPHCPRGTPSPTGRRTLGLLLPLPRPRSRVCWRMPTLRRSHPARGTDQPRAVGPAPPPDPCRCRSHPPTRRAMLVHRPAQHGRRGLLPQPTPCHRRG